MKMTVSILGTEVFSVELLILGGTAETPEEVECDGIRGGESHNFERDTNPLDPSREEPWYDEDRFGFR